jgi:hypothetical protein
MVPAIKSAFGKMTPTKLVASSAVAASPPSLARSTIQLASNGCGPERKAPLPAGPPVSVAVEFWVETINDPLKSSPVFAYVPRQENLSAPQRLVVVLNKALWPTAAALARADANAIRWLVSSGITDRCLCWTGHPVLNAITRYLALVVLGRYKDFERGAWLSYALREHKLTEPIPELIANAKTEPQRFAKFNVEVDSAKLDFWRQKMANRFRRRPLVGAGGNAA